MDFMGDLCFSHSLHVICAVRSRIRTETIRPRSRFWPYMLMAMSGVRDSMTDHSPHAATRGDGGMQDTTKILIGIIAGIIIVIIAAAIHGTRM
jgi:hypothetical protein